MIWMNSKEIVRKHNEFMKINDEIGERLEKRYDDIYVETVRCSECNSIMSVEDNYCQECGHKLRNIAENDKAYKEFCPICKDKISKDMDYCGKYGHKIERNIKERICPICGEWTSLERYCINCSHDFYKKMGFKKHGYKKCPNCGTEYSDNIHYCEDCGTKLIWKNNIYKNMSTWGDNLRSDMYNKK